MRRYFIVTLIAGIGLTAFAVTTGTAVQQYVQICLRSTSFSTECEGRVEFDAGVSIAPRKLPARELAPIALQAHGRIANQYGGHPPALREVLVNVAKDVAIDTAGLPACPLRRLESSRVAAARRLCHEAIVGGGVAHIGFASSETIVEAPLTLFNGGTSGGETRLFVHSAISVPQPIPLVAIGKISPEQNGLISVWRLPSILEGDGSLVDFRLKVNRRFESGGTDRSYLAAKCIGDAFRINIPKILFRNEAKTPGVGAQTQLKGRLVAPCSKLSGD